MTKQSVSLLFSVALSFVWAGVAFAAESPVVYHSPAMNGDNPGTPYDVTNVTDTLDLWYRPGATSTAVGTACLDGDGDEICGITMEIQATGALSLDDFTENVASDLVYNFSPPSTLKINRLNGTVGDDADVPIRLGSLDIIAGIGTGNIAVATTSEATGASLQTLSVVDNGTIAVPEPGVLLGLLVGVSALGFAARRRRSRN